MEYVNWVYSVKSQENIQSKCQESLSAAKESDMICTESITFYDSHYI